jgi:hypothetical protein
MAVIAAETCCENIMNKLHQAFCCLFVYYRHFKFRRPVVFSNNLVNTKKPLTQLYL